ncbi:Uma2 family endonuclease [Kibdelosporangium banguiense]|uniref:Uma2 family endonuclease n=1 Tax=Kibdelosporangium banguiense TaxID=1365924 RepID=A0ABS4TA30_9PSEU|nr:Uma2 family endonuclease [Kibdelosporangium banguiense]MBP2320814.1 Uma2 family endonuclease [Kibdelosporangium banguiense]
MTALPEWMNPPRPEGWFADDLDHLPEAPRHTELIDGALVFMLWPQRSWHGRVVTTLANALTHHAPAGVGVDCRMTIRLDDRNRLEADVMVNTTPFDPDLTWFAPADVLLAVEVVSPESAHRDTTVKLRKYAEAGIAHYWIVEEHDSKPVVHVYELDEPTRAYVAASIFRSKLEVQVPFPITLDLDNLVRVKS